MHTRGVEIGPGDVIQVPRERRAGIMRYELSDDDWATIGPMLPNKSGLGSHGDIHVALLQGWG